VKQSDLVFVNVGVLLLCEAELSKFRPDVNTPEFYPLLQRNSTVFPLIDIIIDILLRETVTGRHLRRFLVSKSITKDVTNDVSKLRKKRKKMQQKRKNLFTFF
jgi:hypothetical protein